MSITLNGVTLQQDLLWTNEFDQGTITQTQQRSVLGNLIVNNFGKVEGREIHLESVRSGESFSGYFTREQVQAFKVLESSAAQVVFEYEGQSFTVFVKADGVQVRPLLPRPNQVTTDYYTGTLVLVTV